MPEFVVQALEVIDIHHNHRHACAESSRALQFFRHAKLEEAAIENSGQSIQIRKLLHAFDVVRILNRSGADVGNGFQRLFVLLIKGSDFGAIEYEHPERLPE